MKKQRINFLILIFSTIMISFYLFYSKQSKEAIIFFPIDPTHYFEYATTHLVPIQSDQNTYSIEWKIDSTLNEPAYLRQDISLLYKNGQLHAVLNKWKQHTQTISQKKKLENHENARYDAISFHYAELHRNEQIYTSVQQMSKARLYTLTTPSFEVFERPVSELQRQWKNSLDTSTNAKTESALDKALVSFQLNKEQYQSLSLTDLPTKANQTFQIFPKKKREELIGKLWEGLYKNYFLGVRKEDGTLVSPEGSSIPQILIANNHREMLILFTLKDGTAIMLQQNI